MRDSYGRYPPICERITANIIFRLAHQNRPYFVSRRPNTCARRTKNTVCMLISSLRAYDHLLLPSTPPPPCFRGMDHHEYHGIRLATRHRNCSARNNTIFLLHQTMLLPSTTSILPQSIHYLTLPSFTALYAGLHGFILSSALSPPWMELNTSLRGCPLRRGSQVMPGPTH